MVDYRRLQHSLPTPVNIQGADIEIVKSYKYLGVHLNNKLDWTDHSAALYKKGQSILFLLRRLRSFGVQGALFHTFYDSVISAIFYDRKRLNRLVRKASSVLGSPLDTV